MTPLDLDHRQLQQCAFALIDPLQGDDETLASWHALDSSALIPRGFEAQADAFPCLIDLNRLSDNQHDHLVALILDGAGTEASSHCVALLQSSADAERASAHLRRLLAPRFPAGKRGVFRFYDPVVFEHLDWMLDDVHRNALLGPAHAWHVPLRGTWHRMTRDADSTRPMGAFSPGKPGWQRIWRIGAIHAVLDHTPEWREAPAVWGPRSEALLIKAEHHRLDDRDDAVAFAVQGLHWHARLDAHPRVLALLAESAGHPKRYRRLSGKLTRSDWQTIHDELEHPENLRSASTMAGHVEQGAYR